MRGLFIGALALCFACKNDGDDGTTDVPTDVVTDSEVTDVVVGDGNDDPSVASALATPSCVAGDGLLCQPLTSATEPVAISPALDKDFYKVTLTAGVAYRFWTQAVDADPADDIDAKVDTVLRFYDPAGAVIAVADDMPFRFGNRDGAIVIQAEVSGEYVLEILDWTHWSNEDDVAAAVSDIRGGADYQYIVYGETLVPEEAITNDTYEDTRVELDPNVRYSSLPFGSTAPREFFGEMSSGADVDWWAFDISQDQDGAYHSWTLWPDSWGSMSPELTLYDATGAMVATSVEPGPSGERSFTWDVSLLYRVTGGQRYFLRVANSGLDDVSGRFYAGLWQGWGALLAPAETEPNDRISDVDVLQFTPSSAGALYTARMSGLFSAAAVGCDPVTDASCHDDREVLKVAKAEVDGTLSGRYLSIRFQADQVGSAADLKFALQKQSGSPLCGDADRCSGFKTAGVNDLDPSIIDYQLTTNDDVFIIIDQESGIGANTRENSWFVLVEVSTEPLYAR